MNVLVALCRKSVVVFFIGTFSTTSSAEPDLKIYSVTITELMARPSYFEGKKVRVVAVANLDFSFEAQPSLYSSKEDWEYSTGNSVDLVGEFYGGAAELSLDDMENLNGEYVVVEGTFRYWSRDNLKLKGGGFVTCWPKCRHYWIEKVSRLDKWVVKRKTH